MTVTEDHNSFRSRRDGRPTAAGRTYQRLATAFAFAFALCCCVLPAPAHAVEDGNGWVYWANPGGLGQASIGRAELDGYFNNANAELNFIAGASGPNDVAIDGEHVYWTNGISNASGAPGTTIGRAGIDGSGADQDFITGLDHPHGIAVDDQYVYWANTGMGTIGRAKLDGSEVDPGFILVPWECQEAGACVGIYGVAVNDQHIYWTDIANGTIGRANIDGSNPTNLLITGADLPWNIAVGRQHIYWTNHGVQGHGTTIGRANLDGSGADHGFLTTNRAPRGVAVNGRYIYWSHYLDGSIGRARLDGSEVDYRHVSFLSGPNGVEVDPGPYRTTIAIDASADVRLGGSVHAGATLSDGQRPSGEITFRLYGPGDADCSEAPVFTATTDVDAGNNVYRSADHVAEAVGTHRWTASYSGDADNAPATTPCNDPAGSVALSKAAPTVAGNSDDVVLGGAVHDTATLAGGFSPTGEIVFELHGPDDPGCAGPPLFTDAVDVDGNGDYASTGFAPAAPGTYRWTVDYSGDSRNEPARSDCTAAGSAVTVLRLPATLATSASGDVDLGGSVRAGADLRGGSEPGGTITFELYGPHDSTCSMPPVFGSEPAAVSGNGVYESPEFTPREVGTYRWVATYSGDAVNQTVSSACDDAGARVTVSRANALGTAYVANFFSGVTSFHTETNIGGSGMVVGAARAVAIAPDGLTAYVVDNNNARVVPIDTRTNALGAAIAVGASPVSIAIAPDGDMAYVASRTGRSITPIDTRTNVPLPPIALQDGANEIAVTPDGATAYVTVTGGHVVPIDTATLTAETPIAVGESPDGIAIAPDGDTAYVTDQAADSVVPIDTRTNTVGPPIAVGDGPTAIAIAPDGGTAYVANWDGDSVTPIDLDAKAPRPSIAVGDSPAAIAIGLDGKTAYVANHLSHDVTPIDTATNTAGTPISAGNRPVGIALVPAQAPTAAFRADPAPAGAATSFDASESADADGAVAGYHWDFGDGQTATTTSPTVEHVYERAGAFTATLTVTDGEGCSTTRIFTGQTVSCNGSPAARSAHEVAIAKASPDLVARASPDGAVGGRVHATATLSGGASPGGSISFAVYGPNDPTCSGTAVFTDEIAVAGDGDYASGGFTPTVLGAYSWTVSYSGDADNEAADAPCGTADRTTAIVKAAAAPTLVAAPNPVAEGEAVVLTATVPGFEPSGDIVFRSGATILGTAPLDGSGEASIAISTLAAGDHEIVAAYAGDPKNEAGESAPVSLRVVAHRMEPQVPPPPPPPSVRCGRVAPVPLNYEPEPRSAPRRKKVRTQVRTRLVPGVRARVAVRVAARLRIAAKLRFRRGGRTRVAKLGIHALPNPGARKLRLPLPRRLARMLRPGVRVKLQLAITATPDCGAPQRSMRTLRTQVVRLRVPVTGRRPG